MLMCQLLSLGGQLTPDSCQTPEDSHVDSKGAGSPSPGGVTCQPPTEQAVPLPEASSPHPPQDSGQCPPPPSSRYRFLSGLAALGLLHPLCMCLICTLCESLSVSPAPSPGRSGEQRPGALTGSGQGKGRWVRGRTRGLGCVCGERLCGLPGPRGRF